MIAGCLASVRRDKDMIPREVDESHRIVCFARYGCANKPKRERFGPEAYTFLWWVCAGRDYVLFEITFPKAKR